MKLIALKSFERYQKDDILYETRDAEALIELGLCEKYVEPIQDVPEYVEPKPKRQYRRRQAVPEVTEVMVPEPIEETTIEVSVVEESESDEES